MLSINNDDIHIFLTLFYFLQTTKRVNAGNLLHTLSACRFFLHWNICWLLLTDKKKATKTALGMFILIFKDFLNDGSYVDLKMKWRADVHCTVMSWTVIGCCCRTATGTFNIAFFICVPYSYVRFSMLLR